MRFDWDEVKRRLNIDKHGIDFIDCTVLFDGPTLTWPDERYEYGEARFITIGWLRDIVVLVAHAETDDSIRLISARKANRHEQEAFFKALGQQD